MPNTRPQATVEHQSSTYPSNPIGTVNPHPHRRMGRVFDRLPPYYEHLRGQRYLINFVNFQAELPNISVEDIQVRLRVPLNSVKSVSWLPQRHVLAHRFDGAMPEFTVPGLETLAMVEVTIT